MFKIIQAWWCFAVAPLYFGGGGGSSASSATTNNTDARLVNSGGVGITNSSAVTVNALDGGAVKGALDLATKANDAAGINYDNLLKTSNSALTGIFSLAADTLKGGFSSLAQSQSQAQATIDTAQSKGTLDNRTITLLGIAATIAAAFIMRGK